ncbi:hypothetical protein F5Y17DRAFT_266892 [Xylariaceae sp. FL0594]|nr:hypothetical protein F5Y17DRAFT_266892 [Xylariaceae sp. FL0594]
MYRNHQGHSSASGPPRNDRYDSYHPPPPPSDLPPPPPPQWESRHAPSTTSRRDSYQFHGRPDDNRFRGPYSDLRCNDSSSYQRDGRDGRHTGYGRDDRDRRDTRDTKDTRPSADTYRPPRGEFTFRQEAPPGIDSYRQYESIQPPPVHSTHQNGRNDMPPSRPREMRRTRGGPYHGQHHRRDAQHQRRGPPKPSDRVLLSKKFDEESELMLGDKSHRASYRNVDDLSDSDEMEMDISDGGDGDANSAEPAAKRARTNVSSAKAAQEAPKWSNPDPYTALPPPEATGRKKDVVHLIRKARVEAEAQKPALSTEAAEFISCDISDDEAPDKVSHESAEVGGDTPAHVPTGNDRAQVPSSINAPITSGSHPLPPKPPVSAFSQLSRSTEHLPQSSGTQHNQLAQLPNPPTRSGQKRALVDLTPSTALGNRKRTIDDEIKPPHAPLKKVNRMASRGRIVPVWESKPGEDSCPWALVDHSDTPNAGTRLHKEIVDFFEYVRPRDFEQKVRQDLITRLERLVRRKWSDAVIFPFGSFMSGLYLPTADMDIAICSQAFVNGKLPTYDTKKSLFHLKSYLERQGVAFRGQVEAITRAKVPLLKYTDNYTGLKVDISFEKMDGYKAINTFLKWKAQYPAMPPLVALIKHFLLMRGLNEPVNGGIGGFSVICMVVHLLQMMPEVQSGSMKPEEHLGEVFMRFLRYYGKEFNYETVAIRMNPPGTISKAKATRVVYRELGRLSIIDPNNPENDISGGSSNYWVIQDSFAKAYEALQSAMMRSSRQASTAPSDPKNTFLGPLFAGRYSTFDVQRAWLEKLARKDFPEPAVPAASHQPPNSRDKGFW